MASGVTSAVSDFFVRNGKDLNVLNALVRHLGLRVEGDELTVDAWWRGDSQLVGAQSVLRRFNYAGAGQAIEVLPGFDEERAALESELAANLDSKNDVIRVAGELACLHTKLHNVFHGEHGDRLYLPPTNRLHDSHHKLLEMLHMMALLEIIEAGIAIFREEGLNLGEVRAAAEKFSRRSERSRDRRSSMLVTLQNFGG